MISWDKHAAAQGLGQLRAFDEDSTCRTAHASRLVEEPNESELVDAPQAALLGVLEHALRVAATSLAVEHSPVGHMAECYEGRLPPRKEILAQLIADQCTELSGLICWYRRSHRRLTKGDSPDEELPF
jgi:hypothetical protein